MRSIPVDGLAVAQAAAIGPHGEGRTDRLLSGGGAERDDDDFTRPGVFLASQGLFDGELIVGIEDELDARFVERFAVGGDLDARLGVGDALDAHGDLHGSRKQT